MSEAEEQALGESRSRAQIMLRWMKRGNQEEKGKRLTDPIALAIQQHSDSLKEKHETISEGLPKRLVPKRNPEEWVEVEIPEIPIRPESGFPGSVDPYPMPESAFSGEPINQEPFKPEPTVVQHTPRGFGFDEASFTDAATVEAHGGKVPLVEFKKVITDPAEVGRLVEAARTKTGVSDEEAKAGSTTAVQSTSNVGGAERGEPGTGVEDGGVVLSGESSTESVTKSLRDFPLPSCPRCHMPMTDEGEFFACKRGPCRQKPISADEVKERYERERGE